MSVSTMHILTSLAFLLVLIVVIKPRVLSNLYSSLLGRIFLITVVLFFAMNNVTLGLLSALAIIIASNMFLHEGLDNMNAFDSNNSDVFVTNTKDIINEQIENKDDTKLQSDGIDLETIKASIQSKSSSSLPLPKLSSSDNISPASTEPFTSMYAPI